MNITKIFEGKLPRICRSEISTEQRVPMRTILCPVIRGRFTTTVNSNSQGCAQGRAGS